MIFFRRLALGFLLFYWLLLIGIEWHAHGVNQPSFAVPNTVDVPVVAVVFYTDEPKARQERLLKAIGFLNAGQASLLVMAGGHRPQREMGYNGAENMRRDAIALGVAEGKVMTDNGSNDSVSNLLSAVASLKGRIERPFRLALVTDRLQLLRLSLIAQIVDLQEPLLKWPLRYVEAGNLPSGIERLRRLNHELLAYLSLLLPATLSKNVLAYSRRS